MEARAPNTDELLDSATGQIKPLQAVLMADGWEENAAAVAACKVRMNELGITPVLPRGDSHGVGDSCQSWPVQDADRLLAQSYRPKVKQQAGTPGTVEGTCSVADDDAGRAASGGRTPTSAVGRSVAAPAARAHGFVASWCPRPTPRSRAAVALRHGAAPSRPARPARPQAAGLGRMVL